MRAQSVVGVLFIAFPLVMAGKDILLYRFYSKRGWPTEGKTPRQLKRMLRVGHTINGFLSTKRALSSARGLEKVRAALSGAA